MRRLACLLFLMFFLTSTRRVVALGPMLKFGPSSGSYSVGSTFSVTVSVDSGTEKTQGIDAWVNFDASRLKVLSVEKATLNTPTGFPFTLDKNISNSSGKFDFFCPVSDISTYEATTVVGNLALVTFEAVSTGTAKVEFACSPSTTIDSNIFDMSSNDVINCSLNQNGSYIIGSSSSSGSGGGAIPTDVPVVSTDNTSSEELPRTGSVGATVGLLIFAAVGVLSSFALRFL